METVAIKIVERVILCDGFYCLVAFRFASRESNDSGVYHKRPLSELRRDATDDSLLGVAISTLQ